MKSAWMEWLIAQARALGPYLAVELLLPGGSLIAILIWLYRSRLAARRTEGT